MTPGHRHIEGESTSGLTHSQRAMLELIVNQPPASGRDLVRHLYANHRTTQGVHQTAASLVRRGYLVKHADEYGHVRYIATDVGRELVAALRSDELQTDPHRPEAKS